jgi:hypothetical protein
MLFGADPPQTLRPCSGQALRGTGLANPVRSMSWEKAPLPVRPQGLPKTKTVVGFMLPLCFSIKPFFRSVMCLALWQGSRQSSAPARPSQERDCASTGSAQTLPCSHPPSEDSQLKKKIFSFNCLTFGLIF